MSKLMQAIRAVLADPHITNKSLAAETRMNITTATKHRKAAIVIIAEIRGVAPPEPPRRRIPVPTLSRRKHNPLKP